MLKKTNSLYFYRAITSLISPFLPMIWQKRLQNKKEIPTSKNDRLGIVNKEIDKKIIWIHAASVGEISIGINIARHFQSQNSNLSFFFTAQTINAYNVFERAKLQNSIFQFAPFDSPQIAKKFVKDLKPILAIFIEGEIWPNFLYELEKNLIPKIYINARLTNKSLKTWNKFSKFANSLFGAFQYIHAANNITAAAISKIIKSEVSEIGNLKFSTPKLFEDIALINKIKSSTKEKKIWLCASSHEGEEDIILNAHKEILQFDKDIILIIAPRHLDRCQYIEKAAQNLNLNMVLKSNIENISTNTNIIIWDSMGELGSAFKIADCCFIAGSLLENIGGHNPIEPAQLNCPIVTGPYFHNFEDIYIAMIESECVIKCNEANSKNISSHINLLLQNSKISKKMALNANNFIENKAKSFDNIILKIKEFTNA